MISIGEAQQIVLAAAMDVPAEVVPLADGLGRVLATDVLVPFDVPPFANSQMDGYAVRAVDLAGVREARPGRLRVRGAIPAGGVAGSAVGPGEAMRIMTGAPLPEGADAVVRLEDTRSEGDLVEVLHEPAEREFVRPAGEDLRAGERALAKGRVLRPADLGLLASMGLASVEVASAPRVAILSSGDELVVLGRPLGPGQIYNSNAYALSGAVREAGGIPVVLPIARDDRASLRRAFAGAASSDVVLSTGGVSVGDHDHTREIMAELGLEERFWRVAQKPGKPIAFARSPRTLYFGLPGNPVSSLVCFFLYVAPVLRRMLGRPDVFPAATEVRMAEPVRTARDLTELVRCRLHTEESALWAAPTGTQSSGALRSLALADALVVSPPGVDQLERGASHRALLFDATTGTAPFA